MRSNTFEHLESMCRGKRIVCERRGRKIELTTPCGGTTAECDTVAEAFVTYRTDPAFAALPIVFAPGFTSRGAQLLQAVMSRQTGPVIVEQPIDKGVVFALILQRDGLPLNPAEMRIVADAYNKSIKTI